MAASKKKSASKRTPAQKRATAKLVAMNKKKASAKKRASKKKASAKKRASIRRGSISGNRPRQRTPNIRRKRNPTPPLKKMYHVEVHNAFVEGQTLYLSDFDKNKRLWMFTTSKADMIVGPMRTMKSCAQSARETSISGTGVKVYVVENES